VQTLIDTRNEIERWMNHPVEFHFASILSPWIRRSLVAAGFGYDARSQTPTRLHDVAPAAVEPPYDALQPGPHSTDIEAGGAKGIELADPSYGTIHRGEASAVQVDTPYFHLDLAEAVAAAEASLLKVYPQSSRSPSISKDEDKLGESG
jgi:sodium-independent sulfate anion transporter 11